MPTGKVTLSTIGQLEPGKTLWDVTLAGFGVRKNHKLRPAFLLKTQCKGRQTWVNIGQLGRPWTIESARNEAKRLIGEAAAGVDIKDKDREKKKKGVSFDVMIDEFLTVHGATLKRRTLEEYTRLAKLHLKPYFKGVTVDQITKAKVTKLHASMKGTPRNANHAIAVLTKFFNWMEEQEYRKVDTNPCRKIKKYKERKRKRYLTPDEMRHLGTVLRQVEQDGSHTQYTIAAILLLLLTGARLSEILTLKWDYVDHTITALNLPDSKTGEKVIWLNKPAIDVLLGLTRLEGNPYVIAGHIHGQRLINLQKPWRAIRALAGLNDVRIHDLRHSFASLNLNNGASLAIVGNLLGHANPQTTARYSHIYDEVAQKTAQKAGMLIDRPLSGKAGPLPGPASSERQGNQRLTAGQLRQRNKLRRQTVQNS